MLVSTTLSWSAGRACSGRLLLQATRIQTTSVVLTVAGSSSRILNPFWFAIARSVERRQQSLGSWWSSSHEWRR